MATDNNGAQSNRNNRSDNRTQNGCDCIFQRGCQWVSLVAFGDPQVATFSPVQGVMWNSSSLPPALQCCQLTIGSMLSGHPHFSIFRIDY